MTSHCVNLDGNKNKTVSNDTCPTYTTTVPQTWQILILK